MLLLLALAIVVCLAPPSVVRAEIRPYKGGAVRAASYEIHYSEGYLVTPGFVDVSGLTFIADDSYGGGGGGEAHGRDDDDFAADDDDEEGGGRSRRIDQELGGGSTVDIVVFHVPDECARSREGCDWTELGVGASDADGNLRWCCSDDAVALGFCKADRQYGRLIINQDKFQGDHRVLAIPASGHIERSITDGRMDFATEEGRYVMIISNCNDYGRDLQVTGSYEFVSKHGHLPGELFGEMYFFAAITVIYFVLFLWYGGSMQCYSESRIEVQSWIILSIGLGFLETFFKTGDYFVWNEDGTRVWYAMYVGKFYRVRS